MSFLLVLLFLCCTALVVALVMHTRDMRVRKQRQLEARQFRESRNVDPCPFSRQRCNDLMHELHRENLELKELLGICAACDGVGELQDFDSIIECVECI